MVNGKFYIGKHQTVNPNDPYLGSGIAIRAAIKFYGKTNFSKEVLFDFDNEVDMNMMEKEMVTESLILDDNCYNCAVGGEGGPHFKGKRHSAETRKNISNLLHSKDKTWKDKMKLVTKQNGLNSRGKKYIMTEEGKQNIIEAQKRRDSNSYSNCHRPMSSSGKESVSAAQKKRWAEYRKNKRKATDSNAVPASNFD